MQISGAAGYDLFSQVGVAAVLYRNRSFLAAATLIALRPCLGLPSFPVVLSGDSGIDLWTLAESVGVVLASLYQKEHVKPLRKYNAEHRWPVMVSYDMDADVVKLRNLKVEDFRHTLFYMADTKAARLFTDSRANILHIRLKENLDTPLIDWPSLYPTIKRLFFERLQILLRDKPNALSDKAFLDREKSYWIKEFTRPSPQIDGVTVLSTDLAD